MEVYTEKVQLIKFEIQFECGGEALMKFWV